MVSTTLTATDTHCGDSRPRLFGGPGSSGRSFLCERTLLSAAFDFGYARPPALAFFLSVVGSGTPSGGLRRVGSAVRQMRCGPVLLGRLDRVKDPSPHELPPDWAEIVGDLTDHFARARAEADTAGVTDGGVEGAENEFVGRKSMVLGARELMTSMSEAYMDSSSPSPSLVIPTPSKTKERNVLFPAGRT